MIISAPKDRYNMNYVPIQIFKLYIRQGKNGADSILRVNYMIAMSHDATSAAEIEAAPIMHTLLD